MNIELDPYARYDSGVSSDFWGDALRPLLACRTVVALAVAQLCATTEKK